MGFPHHATLIMFPQEFIDINFSLQPLSNTVGSTSYLAAKDLRKERIGLNLSEMSSNFGSPWMTSRADNLQYSEIYRPSYVLFKQISFDCNTEYFRLIQIQLQNPQSNMKKSGSGQTNEYSIFTMVFWGKEDIITLTKVMSKPLNFFSAVFI